MSVRLRLGRAALQVTKNCLLFFPRAGGRLHLTVHYAPNPSGRYAGFFSPHVTMPGKSRWSLPAMAPDSVHQFFDHVGEEVRRQWVASVRRVPLNELALAGWAAVVVPPERVHEYLARYKTGDGVFRVRLPDASAIGAYVEMMAEHEVPVETLDDLPESVTWVQIVRVTDRDELESANLYRLPASLEGDQAGAGWYLLPNDWLKPDELGRMIARYCSPEFFSVVRKLGRLLRLPLDESRICELEELAGSTSR